MKTNLLLNAVMSKLISNRDNVLAQLDLILNKSIFDKDTSNIVDKTTDLFLELTNVENTIETVKGIVENNAKNEQIAEQMSQINSAIEELKKPNNQENNGNNP